MFLTHIPRKGGKKRTGVRGLGVGVDKAVTIGTSRYISMD